MAMELTTAVRRLNQLVGIYNEFSRGSGKRKKWTNITTPHKEEMQEICRTILGHLGGNKAKVILTEVPEYELQAEFDRRHKAFTDTIEKNKGKAAWYLEELARLFGLTNFSYSDED